ncbi:Zinc finger protein 256 [Amphibalanus amphitrite]|uniref:Zinc finger protein 256 n=1 Tax=Amphibalanus amphitrite TaxID=1232801 RepID=A0A6A4XEX4_AMPAM|nr:Zinc finger protein 256 [Amphibalanus amphitrite]
MAAAAGPRTVHHCPVCWKPFTHPKSLLQHLPVHTGSTTCPVCGRVCDRKARLNLHMRRSGGGRTPLHCSVCWRAYTNPQSLQKHLPVHRGHTTCRVCGRVFDRVARLNAHVRAAHPGFTGSPGLDRL